MPQAQAQAARAAEEAERAALSADRQAREEAARRQQSEPVYEEPEQVGTAAFGW